MTMAIISLRFLATTALIVGMAPIITLVAADTTTPVFVATEVDQAGPDWLVQGEYQTPVGVEPVTAAQVIATGNGTFTAAFLKGGLPGAGWDGVSRDELTGKTSESATVFAGQAGAAVIRGTELVFTPTGGSAVTLTKITRQSPTMGAKPPAGAVVLFDGTSLDAWDEKAKIHTFGQEQLLGVGAKTKAKFTSYQLHVEFRLPFKPTVTGQDRGNSGIYIHHTYEFQVLDSFGRVAKNNDIGSLYMQVEPLVNACFPPLTWQTYDIDFSGPQFDAAGTKVKNARATVKLNGITVQDNLEIPHGTGVNKAKPETPAGGQLWLQDHANPVVYRNIWLLPKP
jgi:hypothetical protein